MTLGFGLQKGELDHAMVYVEEYLRLDPATHNIQHWNVQKILTKAIAQEMGGVVDQKFPSSSKNLGKGELFGVFPLFSGICFFLGFFKGFLGVFLGLCWGSFWVIFS